MAFVRSVAVGRLSRAFSSGRHVEKSVFISQSSDVYTNLALEEWIGKNYDLKNHHVMLYYKNDPCVVIGNDENPWLDTNISAHPKTTSNKSVALARRQGSGNIIYQDKGSANVTFFSSNDQLDKDYNLALITRAMFRNYGMKLQQEAENLKFCNMNISSTTSTVGSKNTYQNCSLFVDTNKVDLKGALEKNKNAKHNYLNMNEIDPKVTTDGILSAVGWEYMRTPAFALKDGGRDLAGKQRGFQMINPTEQWLPGIAEIRSRLARWDWCYGSTPDFTIQRMFPVPAKYLNAAPGSASELRVKIEVAGGRIREISLFVPPGLSKSGFTGEAKVITDLKGQRFTEEALKSIESILGVQRTDDTEKFVTECVRQAMFSF